MKKLILIILSCFLIGFTKAQTYPINEPFNSVSAWTCTNGSGLQTYGGGLNYLTTNIGTTPYPNGSTITMTSPVYSFTNCLSNLTVTFPINGRIENGYDFMTFQYFNAGTWTTLATHTGVRNNVLYTYVIPNTATRFRFRLITDATINSFGFPFVQVYYYDIDYFNIDCTSVLPIEIILFEGNNYDNKNNIKWSCASELNNENFILSRSIDAINWNDIKTIKGAGTSYSKTIYEYNDFDYNKNSLNYYKLTQIDFDGNSKSFNIIVIDNTKENKNKNIIKITNLFGQEVDDNYRGVKIYTYSDGTYTKKVETTE